MQQVLQELADLGFDAAVGQQDDKGAAVKGKWDLKPFNEVQMPACFGATQDPLRGCAGAEGAREPLPPQDPATRGAEWPQGHTALQQS
jgi:hypothetical protein